MLVHRPDTVPHLYAVDQAVSTECAFKDHGWCHAVVLPTTSSSSKELVVQLIGDALVGPSGEAHVVAHELMKVNLSEVTERDVRVNKIHVALLVGQTLSRHGRPMKPRALPHLVVELMHDVEHKAVVDGSADLSSHHHQSTLGVQGEVLPELLHVPWGEESGGFREQAQATTNNQFKNMSECIGLDTDMGYAQTWG